MGDPVAVALIVVALVAWVVMTRTIIRQDRRNARKDRERMDKEERERMLKLADVGLRAVIDEATGYQEVRSPSDLRDYAAELGLDDVNAAIDARLRETGH